MDSGSPDLEILPDIGRQAPHCPHSFVPMQFIGLRIPRITAEFQEIHGSLQPRLALLQALLSALLFIDILQGRDRPDDRAGVIAERRRAHADPGFAPVIRHVKEIDARRDGFSSKGPGARKTCRREDSAIRIEGSPAASQS